MQDQEDGSFSLRPYWQYYKTCIPFILVFAILATIVFGNVWGGLLFITLGPFIGLLAYNSIYNNQYYFYYNLGITKIKLLKYAYILNAFIGVPIFILISLIVSIVVGNLSII